MSIRAMIIDTLNREFPLDDPYRITFYEPDDEDFVVREKQFNNILGTVFNYRVPESPSFGDGNDTVVLLDKDGTVREIPTNLHALVVSGVFGVSGYRLCRTLIEEFLHEIREIICNKKRRTEAALLTNKKISPIAASLSALVLNHFAVTEPVAIGVATYIFIVVFEASRGAFCSTTDKDMLARLREADNRPPPESWDDVKKENASWEEPVVLGVDAGARVEKEKE
jgi:hypothetical protein